MLDTIFKPHLQSQGTLIKCADLNIKQVNELRGNKSPLKVWFPTRKYKLPAQCAGWYFPDRFFTSRQASILMIWL